MRLDAAISSTRAVVRAVRWAAALINSALTVGAALLSAISPSSLASSTILGSTTNIHAPTQTPMMITRLAKNCRSIGGVMALAPQTMSHAQGPEGPGA